LREVAPVLLEIPSTLQALQLVDLVAEHFGNASGLDEEAVHWFCVAVREAAANALKHGNACDPRKRVHIVFDGYNDNGKYYVRVCVRDQGAGFEPECVPDPLAEDNRSRAGGRGLFLMRTFMDDVSVGPAPNGGTEIVMVKSVNRAITD
jgi:serine/threonine-protein kinase RsbW